jgi:predicted negative regulator of RcsB-dependent stress response
MKSSSSKTRGPKQSGKKAAPAPVKPGTRFPYLWSCVIGIAAALVVVFIVYDRAMNGPFLFDDTYLAYRMPAFWDAPLTRWIGSFRPLLMLSYWVNFHLNGQATYAYHLVNVILHFLNGVLIFLALRKLLHWAGTGNRVRETTAIFAAGLFLLHPLQTESVSYIASRSETLSVFFFLAAFVVFLYRKSSSISILAAIGVLLCFGAACASKEHTVILPALLLLTDYYWNPGFSLKGIWRNWKLYVPIVAVAGLGGAYVLMVVLRSASAGFHVAGLNWYQYFFTQCRVVWKYISLFVFPFGQNLDADAPISRSIVDHGAIVGLLGLLAVSVAAWIYRRRFPLASYGWFVFLFLLAPTSSVIPIADPYAERRLYLPFIGLLLIAAEFVRRWKASRMTAIATLSAVLLFEAVLTFQRNALWGDAIALWKVTAEDSPGKLRPSFQYAMALSEANRDGEAIKEFSRAASLEKPNFGLLLDWGLAYERTGDHEKALAKLKEAAALEAGAHVYTQIALVYSKQENYTEALKALDLAQLYDPGNATIFQYRGNILLTQGNTEGARQQFRRAVELDRHDEYSRRKLQELGG